MASIRRKGRDPNLMVRSKLVLYGITVIVSLLFFVIFYTPASLVYKLFQDDIARLPDTSIFQITGSIWNGSADIQYRNFPSSKINWILAPKSLPNGYAEFTLRASGVNHDLEGRFVTNGNQGEFLGLRGIIDSKYINQVGKYHGIFLSGALDFRDINLSIDDGWFSSVSGKIDWTGGKVMFQTEDGGQTVNLPALNGVVSLKEKKLALHVYNGDQLGFLIYLQRDGWVFLQFKSRFLSLAGFPGGEYFDPDSVIFTIEEKIL